MGREDATKGAAPGSVRGIVIGTGGRSEQAPPAPRIAAFVWGGRVQPAPTLPFGRWKSAA